jgi:hypothetical protein
MFPLAHCDMYAIKGCLHKAEEACYVAGDHVAILASCRTIYNEAKPVLYSNTSFSIYIRDNYWLHTEDDEQVMEMFDLETMFHEPDSDDWIEHNPWLQDPRSIVPVSKIRTLTLAIECNSTVAAQKRTWTGQLKHTLRGAPNIRRLHLALMDPLEGFVHQESTDRTLRDLGQIIRCRGVVTASMDPRLGSMRFDTTSYYQMLATCKG